MLRLQVKTKMQSECRPAPVRDTVSLGPLLSDKLSSRLRGQDRPSCLPHKELPSEAIGIADALHELLRHQEGKQTCE